MQTFLPYPDFYRSLCCLDTKRLGKQRVESYQLIRAIENSNPKTPWKNHPAAKMWSQNVEALKLYHDVSIKTWIERGYKNTMALMIPEWVSIGEIKMPDWFGREDFHLSHQSNLVRKNPEHYGTYFPGVPGNLPYVWPIV